MPKIEASTYKVKNKLFKSIPIAYGVFTGILLINWLILQTEKLNFSPFYVILGISLITKEEISFLCFYFLV